MLKDNIKICVIAFGWEKFKTQWSRYRRHKSIQELERRLKEMIEKTKSKNIPPQPKVPIPERTNMGILGQITHQVSTLDEKVASTASDFDKGPIEKWKINEYKRKVSMHKLLQNPDPPRVDESLLRSSI